MLLVDGGESGKSRSRVVRRVGDFQAGEVMVLPQAPVPADEAGLCRLRRSDGEAAPEAGEAITVIRAEEGVGDGGVPATDTDMGAFVGGEDTSAQASRK